MSYTPNNVSVYLAAFSGCLASIGSPGTTNPSVDAPALADAFAQAVDTQWGSAAPTAFEITSIQQLSLAAWSGRSPLVLPAGLTPSSYSAIANAIVTLAVNGNSQIVGEGINPNSPASPSSPSGGLTPPANGSWSVANWWIDPVGGSDLNTGKTAGSPLKTWKALVALWGTISPILRQSTTITFLTSQSDNTDPVIFQPVLANGAMCVISGTLTQVGAGTLGTITAKNRSTPQLLKAATLPAGAAADVIIVNTAKSSSAIIYSSAGGGAWNISQPQNNVTAPFTSATEDDTWSTGNAVTLYTTTGVNIVSVSATLADYDAVNFNNFLYLQNLTIFDPSGAGDDHAIIGDYVYLNNVISQKLGLFPRGAGDSTLLYVNASFRFGNTSLCPAPLLQFSGGIIGSSIISTVASGFVFANDVILAGQVNMKGLNVLNNAYVDTGVTLFISDNCTVANHVWGPGSLEVDGCGTLLYPSGANQAVATLLIKGGFKLNGLTTAFSVTSAGTLHGGITISAANLDAAAGVAGFGGTAFLFSGAAISNGQL